MGCGVVGALWGTLLAVFVIGLITYWVMHCSLEKGRDKAFKTTHVSFKPILLVFISNTAFAAMSQLDMIQVNYYFSAHEAGLYAAASILGKAVMYLPGGIALALFPMVAENHARDEASAHLLFQALRLVLILCGIGALFYFFCGNRFIQLLYGESYPGAGEILRYYGFAILPMTLAMLVENFLIAKGQVIFAYLFLIGVFLQILAVHLWHDSLLTVVFLMAFFGILLTSIGFGLLWRIRKRG
jgi:O-antigen/teichoic acid export membrane protein